MSVDLTGGRPFVFLSHSHTRRAYVERLARHLVRRGIPIWYDVNISGGEDWEKALEEHMRGCVAVVVVMSAGAERSRWITAEINTARRLRKKLYPLLLDGERFASLSDLQEVAVRRGRLPNERWIRTVREEVGGTDPGRRRWPEVIAGAATLALVAGGVLLFNALRGGDGGAPADCTGKAAHIERVSTEAPGHTGHHPRLTVTVCTAAEPHHQYWIMDYTEEGTLRAFYPKAAIAGTPGRHDYEVEHSAATTPGSSRVYVVVDVPDERLAAVHSWQGDDDQRPVVRDTDGAPPGLTIVSNGLPAML